LPPHAAPREGRAYWDSEIKRAKVAGRLDSHDGYGVDCRQSAIADRVKITDIPAVDNYARGQISVCPMTASEGNKWVDPCAEPPRNERNSKHGKNAV
jgi:hypothetical protein